MDDQKNLEKKPTAAEETELDLEKDGGDIAGGIAGGRGNAVDMAVGVIIGGAFGKIVTSLVDNNPST